MATKLTFDDEAREALERGADKLADAVTATLGPGGKEVMIQQPWGSPKLTKDGVTVAKAVELEDEVENMGATLLKEAAIKTNDVAGDGTTSATLIAQNIYNKGLKAINADNLNPVYLRRGIEKAVATAVSELESIVRTVSDAEDIRNVALVSSNHDEVVAQYLGLAISGGTVTNEGGEEVTYEGVGPKGTVTVREGKSHETTVEFVEGYEFDRGYFSPYLITNTERMAAELDNTDVFIYDGKLGFNETMAVLGPWLEEYGPKGRELLLVAEDFDPEATQLIIVNKLKGVLRAAAVKSPGFGERRKQMIEDIATVTGGRVFSPEKGDNLIQYAETGNTAEIFSGLGNAERVDITRDSTTIIGAGGEPDTIGKRVKQLEGQIESTDSDYDREKLEERIGKIKGQVAVISIGAYTEFELEERKYRVEDALNATRAASLEGIVPGGGVTYLRLGEKLRGYAAQEENVAMRTGMEIVADALSGENSPVYRIAENAGVDDPISVMEQITSNDNLSFGYNALTEEFGDMYDLGIIDPTLVVRSAIENAASVAVHLLNTQCVVTEIPEKDDHDHDVPGM